MDHTGNIAWHHLFFYRKRACSAGLCCTRWPFVHGYCWLVEVMRTWDTAMMACRMWSAALAQQHADSFLTCQQPHSLQMWKRCNRLIHRWYCEGPKCPARIHKIREKNRDIFYLLLFCLCVLEQKILFFLSVQRWCQEILWEEKIK